ncbi:MAG: Hpt domain-containing protein, partial [Deltaproteobacteria bacterium]|nr:Hpt domain-containing protein [Deltaproteobacteria bacterium]
MSDRVDLREFIGAFVVEADELVAASNTALLEIEEANSAGTSRPRAVRDLFRALHTIKGLAGMIGVEPIVDIAHALETLIRAADRAGGTLRSDAVEISLQGVSAIAERIRAVAENREVVASPTRLLETIGSIAADAPVELTPIPREWETRLAPSERQQLALALQTQSPVWNLTFTPSEANAARGVTIATVRAALKALGEIIKVMPRTIAAAAAVPTGVAFDILLVSTATREQIAEVASTTAERVVQVVTPTSTATATATASATAPAPEAAPVIAAVGVSPANLSRVTEVIRVVDLTESIESLERAEPATIGRALVRVELSRLDELQDQLSLLIVSRFRLEREVTSLAALGHDVRRLNEIVQVQGRQLRDLRRAILRARMVRVSEVLDPLPLLVRSLARASQREVRLELDRCDLNAELDKAVADRLLPALIHLVRNAVDHAIEAPDLRVEAGKPRTGTVRVSCREVAGNHLELVVSDDGRGNDRAAIARRANPPIEDDPTMLEVLTAPGFSTREVATTTSGRGLGMDIVRRIAVSDLGGELSMVTQVGVGTAFTLRVPVTIAVMDVFAFQCGLQSFVVPAAVVEEIIELPE